MEFQKQGFVPVSASIPTTILFFPAQVSGSWNRSSDRNEEQFGVVPLIAVLVWRFAIITAGPQPQGMTKCFLWMSSKTILLLIESWHYLSITRLLITNMLAMLAMLKRNCKSKSICLSSTCHLNAYSCLPNINFWVAGHFYEH